MKNLNHCMSIKQAKLIVNAHKHNLLNSFLQQRVMLHNMKTTEEISQISRESERQRERERETGRQTETQTEKQRERETERELELENFVLQGL